MRYVIKCRMLLRQCPVVVPAEGVRLDGEICVLLVKEGEGVEVGLSR